MNLLGIDFEDWFHPELIQKNLKEDKNPIMSKGIDKILDLLRIRETSATFFVVGETLESSPELLDKILSNDHEIGFHTMYHTRLENFSRESFEDELKKFAKLTSFKSKGFRAPSFSLNFSTSWIIELLENNGYVYDSSIMPVKTRLYGIANAENKPYKISSKSVDKNDEDGKLWEFPLLTTKFFGKQIPASGGFYLRFLPLKLIKSAISSMNKNEQPSTFYIHSWELVPELMPKIKLPFLDNFVTYYNLKSAYQKMSVLLKEFQFTSFNRFLNQNSFL
ncbi:MAG: polysaccharide deacetylase family protein [Thaumarchaeota archaeon]|nr:polysaccharide deacetylase family protein [Nitrososphaerota archaeon]